MAALGRYSHILWPHWERGCPEWLHWERGCPEWPHWERRPNGHIGKEARGFAPSLPDMMIVRIPGTLPPKSHLVISPLPRRRKTEDSQFFPFLPSHCLTLFLSPLFLSLLLSDNNASPAAIMRQPYALHYRSFLCIFSIAPTLPLYPIHRHRVLGYHTRSPTQCPLSDFTVTTFPLYSVLTHPDQTH